MKLVKWYRTLSKRFRDSISYMYLIIGAVSTIFTVIGISFDSFVNLSVVCRLCILIVLVVVMAGVIYFILGALYKDLINLTIGETPITICVGDIFDMEGFKVIDCDTHFDTRIDDIVISKTSLHGQLVLEHGNKEEIKAVVENEAKKLGLTANDEGLYDFPLGTVIRYDSSVDNNTYLMLAMTELSDTYKAHTNMVSYEIMLMKMWDEISRVYAGNDVVLPILGTGITRFDDGAAHGRAGLLKCMLCTLNSCGIDYNSKLKIVIYGNADDVPLYEYKDLIRDK